MEEILVSQESTTRGGKAAKGPVVEVFVKPASFLGDSFRRYLQTMRDAAEAVYETTSSDYRLKFDRDSKTYRILDVYEEHAAMLIETISEKIWEAGFVPVDEAPKSAPVTKVEVVGVMDLFESVKGKLKFPKIRLETGEGNKLVLSLAGERSKYTGQVMLTDGGPFGQNVWYGRIDTDGSVYPSRSMSDDVMSLLNNLSLDAAKVAGSHGRRTGNCCFCNRHLEDKRSTEVGYGPICAEHYGLPWGEGN